VSQNHYFVAKVTTKGIAYELLKLLRVPMEGNGGMKMSVGERIPIDLAKLVERRAAKCAKRGLDSEEAETELDVLKWESRAEKGGPFQVHARDLQDMFTYCNALVAQTMVEQQLKDRGIPYTTQFPDENDFAVPRSRSALAGMVPNICVNASHLFKDGRAAEVASPKVFLVIKNWWSGRECNVETIVRLRHQPSLDSQPAAPVARASEAGRAEGITFDQNTLTVRFHAPSIARCVPDFLEQWERLSKVIVVAGEGELEHGRRELTAVNRLNKQEEFRDIRMLSFDLCTASVQYAPGFNVAITYTPTSDSYEASFSRSGVNSATPAPTGMPHTDGGDNPHAALAPLLSAHLNELTQLAPAGGRGHAGRDFLQLLRATLPLLLEAEALRVASASPYPALVVRSVTEYRLVWDHEAKTPARYALDVLLTQASGARFLLCDATRRKDVPDDLTCGPLTPIPNVGNAMLKGFQAAKIAKVSTPSGPAGTPRTPNPKTPGKGVTPKEGRVAVKSITPVMPPAARLDAGESMMCSVGVMHDVLRAISNEIEIAIGGVPMGPGSARG
jgi:mediator of RNA polymerase II transcription subunit 14